MQRLFSMFPAARPGVALLLIRAAVALMMVDGVAKPLLQLGSPWWLLAPAAVALALGLGVLTPIASALCVLLQLVLWASLGETIEIARACAVLVAVAVGLLGPGAYSLDARMFGRRRVSLRDTEDV